MKINGIVLKMSGIVSFADGYVGPWHAQSEWNINTGSITWSIDPVNTHSNYDAWLYLASAEHGAVVGYTSQLVEEITLSNNAVYSCGLFPNGWHDKTGWHGDYSTVCDNFILDPTEIDNVAQFFKVMTDVYDVLYGLAPIEMIQRVMPEQMKLLKEDLPIVVV